jgi:hypothetical protein
MRADTLRRESPRCAGGFGWIRSVFSTLRSSRAWPLVNTQGAPRAVSMPVVQPDADALSCGPKARREPSSGSSGWRVFAADCWTGGQWRMGRFHKALEGARPRVPLSITALRQTHRERRPSLSASARFWRTPGLRGPLDPGLRWGEDGSGTPVQGEWWSTLLARTGRQLLPPLPRVDRTRCTAPLRSPQSKRRPRTETSPRRRQTRPRGRLVVAAGGLPFTMNRVFLLVRRGPQPLALTTYCDAPVPAQTGRAWAGRAGRSPAA